LQRAYQAHVDAGSVGPAVRSAFWLQHSSHCQGDFTQAGAWLARAGRLTADRPDCAEIGYLLVPG
jgi:hypothetical protein